MPIAKPLAPMEALLADPADCQIVVTHGFALTFVIAWWIGMPIFTFEDDKVRDLYVLGDIYGLIERMRSAST